jgi:hypothetical protein
MLPPIIVYNKGDVLLFMSASDAERYLEPIDVLNSEYVAYDSEGKLLEIVIQHGVVALTVPIEIRYRRCELREIVCENLVAHGLQQDQLSTKTLHELILIRLTYKTD